MPRLQILSDAQMAACRWEYENTPIGQRELGRKYGWDPRVRIGKERWRKAEVLKTYEGPEGEKEYRKDLAAAVKDAFNKKMIQGMQAKLEKAEKDAAAKAEAKATTGRIRKGSAAQPVPDRLVKPNIKSLTKPLKPDDEADEPSKIVAFPGSFLPPSGGKNTKFTSEGVPPRSKADQAATKIHLSMLRGEISLRQLQQLEEQDEVLADYRHLLSCYMNPGRFVDTKGMDEDEAREKLKETSVAALRLLLPTERDTLAGAVLTLNRAIIASIAATRSVLGIAAPRPRAGVSLYPDEAVPGDPASKGTTAGTLDLEGLRSVKRAMELLTGQQQEANEPPMPPPPESLDDLVVDRGEEPPPAPR